MKVLFKKEDNTNIAEMTVYTDNPTQVGELVNKAADACSASIICVVENVKEIDLRALLPKRNIVSLA